MPGSPPWRSNASTTSSSPPTISSRGPANPATAAITSGAYRGVKLVKIDAHTLRAVFDKPNPVWADSYSIVRILPKSSAT